MQGDNIEKLSTSEMLDNFFQSKEYDDLICIYKEQKSNNQIEEYRVSEKIVNKDIIRFYFETLENINFEDSPLPDDIGKKENSSIKECNQQKSALKVFCEMKLSDIFKHETSHKLKYIHHKMIEKQNIELSNRKKGNLKSNNTNFENGYSCIDIEERVAKAKEIDKELFNSCLNLAQKI